jgi:hypothetical protein
MSAECTSHRIVHHLRYDYRILIARTTFGFIRGGAASDSTSSLG